MFLLLNKLTLLPLTLASTKTGGLTLGLYYIMDGTSKTCNDVTLLIQEVIITNVLYCKRCYTSNITIISNAEAVNISCPYEIL